MLSCLAPGILTPSPYVRLCASPSLTGSRGARRPSDRETFPHGYYVVWLMIFTKFFLRVGLLHRWSATVQARSKVYLSAATHRATNETPFCLFFSKSHFFSREKIQPQILLEHEWPLLLFVTKFLFSVCRWPLPFLFFHLGKLPQTELDSVKLVRKRSRNH